MDARKKKLSVDRVLHNQLQISDAQRQSETGRLIGCSTLSRRNTSAHGHDISTNTVMHAAAWAMPLWFGAQYTFNTSLAYTSVTSNTILSSTSSFFTFLLSMLLLGESYSSSKLLAIAACIAGTAFVTLSDTESSPSSTETSLLGDGLTVLSTCLYACYTVVMRLKLPGEEAEANVGLFFGYLGLFNTVLMAPVVVILLSTGVFSLSSVPKQAYLIILLEGLLDYVLSDYLWARAVIILGPTVASLGLSAQIPMAAAADLALGRAQWIHSVQTVLMTLGGTMLIMLGFFGINLAASATSTVSLEGASGTGGSAHMVKRKNSDVYEQQALLSTNVAERVTNERGFAQTEENF
ncbi:hypothetical protein CEUSTIGMA_g559.t1 [Chlamydomonas eustigma]|uniref:EamA domain-containing protein n=1 Tax=Chlamydomonas eustigma TaxID=1157962 RepID=A0A250WQY5_9CHLO|nr:hypothetical protein CEUSTIGMA_g559.t1 [Chlamydomonas eustigma]|eukprot:GAX73106.1 hypothetical protein CEUSTIGMA_g559.t1 [Chlamydomonas eustigma]